MFNKANVVGILIKAKKHGLVFFDGEIVFAVKMEILPTLFHNGKGF